MKKSFRSTVIAAAACAAILAAGLVISSQRMRAAGKDEGDDDSEQAKIKIGLAIAPVPLNLKGKNRELVYLGSYIVNAQGDCNGCHTSDASAEYVFGAIPYFGQHPKKVDPANYLRGGNSFGSLIPGSAEIVSRNLTPDKTGRPEGGNTFEEFKKIIRTGVDADKWHPTCTGAPGPHCIPAPFDGSLLQVMPWPTYQDMTDHDLRAIYEYLSSIPCLEGDPGNPTGANTNGHRCK